MTSGTYPWLFVMLRFLEKKRCQIRLYLQLFVGGFMSYLRYFCLFTYSVVYHILCCVLFCLSSFLCTLCCQFLWIVHLFYCPFRILQRLIMTKYLHLQKYSKLHTCADKKIQSNSQKYLFHNFLDLFLVIVLIIFKWRSSVIGYVFINCMTAYWSIRY